MNIQMTSFEECKKQYLAKASELKKERDTSQGVPDMDYEDQIGEMATSLLKQYKKQSKEPVSDLEEIQLYREFIMELKNVD